ncbi:MAG: hypothetical protein AVDCRST_MAG77-5047 [uncultured Chloroflexi bacterium]|uniref:histidine kinase n=1 Tax=uncultured Chloroflexota bacterium TaxID=166587 RepID=A0A6J4K457_9CHLR|nr:MAG: hypothetical protein AVDCRST_MAG77-5047 [uncultured Chloroflexota bacterium]
MTLGTEKDRMLAQLEEERRRQRAVLEQMPAGVAIAEAPSGRLVLHNAEAVRLLRHPMLPAAEVSGYGAYGALHPDGTPYLPGEHPMARAVRGEVVRDHEMRYRRGDGTDTYLSVSASPIQDAQGRITAAVTAFHDVGERKRAEAERAALLGAVTHDLKNPLTAISGVVQVLQRQAAAGQLSPERLNDRLAVLAGAVTRMRTQLDEMTQTVEWSEGVTAPALARRPIDLVELARGVAAGRQLGTESHDIRVEVTETADEGLVVEVDPARMERVLDNLLANAVKYSPRGGAITVTVRREPGCEGWAVVAIRDEGIGIPPADLPRVFERFRRGSNVGRLPGTGIGLAAAKQIVEAHGGAIAAESGEGEGSTITVRLPLARAAS